MSWAEKQEGRGARQAAWGGEGPRPVGYHTTWPFLPLPPTASSVALSTSILCEQEGGADPAPSLAEVLRWGRAQVCGGQVAGPLGYPLYPFMRLYNSPAPSKQHMGGVAASGSQKHLPPASKGDHQDWIETRAWLSFQREGGSAPGEMTQFQRRAQLSMCHANGASHWAISHPCPPWCHRRGRRKACGTAGHFA